MLPISEGVVVCKFGGTSVGDVPSMIRSARVALQRGAHWVVVSATAGTTNDLIRLGKVAEAGNFQDMHLLLEKITLRHRSMAKKILEETLDPDQKPPSSSTCGDPHRMKDFMTKFEEKCQGLESLIQGVFLLREVSHRAMDTLLGFGEDLSSLLFALTIEILSGKAQWEDARNFILTDSHHGQARPRIPSIKRACAPLLERLRGCSAGIDSPLFVTQGFVGRCEDRGVTTTLGRGGSDYSAALFAEALEARVLEIWTDVPGIATTDPRLHDRAQWISEISFQEASELATFGAKVLHPATVLPALRQNIPIYVGSSFTPDRGGTWILPQVNERPLIRALALRSHQTLITLSNPEMLHAHGFLHQIFQVFNHHRISVDAITTSEISVSLTLDQGVQISDSLIQDLKLFAEVQIETDLSLISLIGNGIRQTPGLAHRIFSTLSDVHVRMICMGASPHNFCFLVQERDGRELIRRLHDEFIPTSSSSSALSSLSSDPVPYPQSQ